MARPSRTINFYAQGKTDIEFDVFFDAKDHEDAERIADENGWILIGQEEGEETFAMVELMLVKPRLH